MKALQKDTIREIKRTKSRFFSIMVIIALAVAFYVGVKATGPSMKYTADDYYQTLKLMDFRLISTYGFKEADIAAIKNTQGIHSAMPGYTADVIIDQGDERPIIRLYSLSESGDQNQVQLVKGRLPENSGEIALEAPLDEETTALKKLDFKLGETITLDPQLGSEKRSETVAPDKLKVVGFVNSPQYVSVDRGTSAIGSGNVALYGFIKETDFAFERYTVVFARTTASEEGVSAFSEDYWTAIDAIDNRLSEVGAERIEINHTKIMNEAQKKLDDGRQAFNEGQREFLEGIASGEIKLDQARRDLAAGQEEYQQGLNDLNAMIQTTQADLAAARQELNTAEAQLILGRQQLDDEIRAANAQLDEGRAGISQLEAGIKEMEDNDPSDQLPGLEKQLEQVQARIAEGEEGIAALDEQILGLEQMIEDLDPEADDYQAQKTYLEGQIADLEEMIAGINEELQPAYQGQKELQAGIDQILEFQESLKATRTQLDDLRRQVAQGEEELAREKAAGEAKLSEGQRQLEAGRAQLARGTAEFQDGVNRGRAELAAAKRQLDSGLRELQEGQATLDKERREGQALLAEKAQELADAEKKISEIEKEKWYFFDRKDNPGYESYGEDAQRIENIAAVFPIFFLLIAALVSFTTMTRMVEEQRTQIGTLKALGYKHYQIAAKYLIYALLAGSIGSLVGVVVGLNTLPYLITQAYKMMYLMPALKVDPPWIPVIISSLIGILCTVIAAGVVTHVELKEHPSQLMRPKAPKIGKRIFLERIPLLWKRLGFIEKVTARNLMRYKGRFFMTVIGIAGCTALMLAGFGLQDAIFTIVPKQFEEINIYDGVMAFKEAGSLDEKRAIKTALNQDSRFTDTMMVYQNDMKIEKAGSASEAKSIFLVVPESSQAIEKFIGLKNRISGQDISLKDEQVVITEKISRDLALEVGDTIRIFDEDQAGDLVIGGVTENYINHYLYLSPQAYQQAFDKEATFNIVYFNSRESNGQIESQIANDWLEDDAIVSINFTGDIVASSQDSMSSLNIVVLVLILSAGALAGVVLYNLTNINISERVREIATIQVLGFYDMEVYKYIFRENIVLSIIGVIGGSVLGTYLTRLIINTVETDLIMFGRGIELSSYLYSIVLTLVFSLIINIMMTPIIKGISMVEALKSIE